MKKFRIIQVVIFLFISNICFSQTEEDIYKMSLEELMNLKIITSSKYEQEKSESPSTITVITEADIKAYGYQTVWDALKTVVGVISSDNGNGARVGMRGVMEPSKYNSRILWLIDGHTMNDSYFQWDFPDFRFGLDIGNIRKIEIIRGPASVLYGSNAFSGVVNVVTKNGEDVDGLKVTSNIGGVLTTAGGFNIGKKQPLVNVLNNSISYGKKIATNESFMISATYYKNFGQFLFIPFFSATKASGIAEKMDFNEAKYLFAKYKRNDFTLTGIYSNTINGRPLADYDSDPNNINNKGEFEKSFIELKHDHEWNSDIKTMFRTYYDNHDYKAYWIYDNNPDLDVQSVPGKIFGGEGNISLRIGNELFLGGLEYQNHSTSQTEKYPSENYYSTNNYDFYNYAFYLQNVTKLFENLKLNIGIRYENNKNYGPVFIWRSACVFHIEPGTILKLQYGDAFVNPLLHDYFYHSSILNKYNYEIVKLERERARTFEFVVENNSEILISEINLYYSINDKFVDVNPLDYYNNLNGIYSIGSEGEFRFILSNRFDGYFNIIYQITKDKSTKEKVINVPDLSFKYGILGKFFEKNQMTLGFEGQFYGNTDFRDIPKRPNIDFKQNAFLIANLNINYKLLDNLDLSLGIFNLFNTAYQNAISKGEVQPFFSYGRSYNLKLNFGL